MKRIPASSGVWRRGVSRWLHLPVAFLSCRHGAGKQAPPRGPLDILIFGPHPDDSAIGGTGLMVKALGEGKRVGVVVVTNGDGYPEAAGFENAPAREARVRVRIPG